MRQREPDKNQRPSEDLEDIEIVRNLLELRSRLGAKNPSMENDQD